MRSPGEEPALRPPVPRCGPGPAAAQELPVPATLSRPVSSGVVAYATMVKGLQIARRYVPNLVGRFVNLALRMLFFLLIANAVSFKTGAGEAELGGRELFIFFQGGLLILVFQVPALWGPINSVTSDLYNGTLEYLYSGPGSRYAYYVGNVLSEVVLSLVLFVPFYLYLVAYSRPPLGATLLILLATGVALVTLTALGVMIGILALLWRQVNSLAQVLGILFDFLAGAYLPVSTFPEPLQWLAYLLPFTWAFDLVRYYSMGKQWTPLLPVWQEWAILCVYAVGYTLLSRFLLDRAERMVKQRGLHII